jgi:hypothetical protein
MAKAMAKVEIEIPDDGRAMFVVVEPGWSVLDCREGGARAIEVSYEGARVH